MASNAVSDLSIVFIICGFPHSSVGKESSCNVGDPGSIPGLGISPGEGKIYPLQYSGLENSMVAKSPTQLNDFYFTCHLWVHPKLILF